MKKRTLSIAAALLCAVNLNAAVTWTGATDTTWSQPDTTSWDATYNSGDDVIFTDTGVGTVTLDAGNKTPANISFTHSSGTYSFLSGGGNIAATGSLSISGTGTVQFGNMGNSPLLATWTSTSITGGGSLNFTRPNGYIGSSGSTITLNNGTLRLGTDNSATYTANNAFSIGANGGTIVGQYTGNVSKFDLTGNFSGSGALKLQNAGDAGNFTGAPGLRISGTDNSGYNGAVSIVSSATQPGGVGSGMTTFGSAGSLFSNASSVTVRDGGIMGFSYAMAASALGNVTVGPRGGIGATGASGTLTALSDPMAYVGKGGVLLLDNRDAINNNRLADTAAIALDSDRLYIIGRNSNSVGTNESVGDLNYSGSGRITLDLTNTTNAGVKLTVSGNMASPSAGNSLQLDVSATTDEWGSAANQSHIIVSGAKPTVTNGMISPGVQYYSGGNLNGSFMTFSGNDLIKASYTAYAGDFAAAGSTEIVDYTAATDTTLSGSGTLSIHALRLSGAGNLNLGGRTVALGSGGLIMTSRTISNGVLDIGSGPGFFGAYNTAAQANISAAVSGSGGLTIMGSSQSFNFTGTNSSLTGGIYVNGATASFTTAAANGNNVTVNAFGRLTGPNSNTSLTIGGLSGDGRVASFFQGNNTNTNSLVISPSAGTHTFNGRISNGDAGRVLSIVKSGSGTQVFGTDSVGVYTGTTQVNVGTLLVNGDFSAATGNVTVDGSGSSNLATLGGTGKIGGATTIGTYGVLSPGSSPGTLTFTNTLSLGGETVMEIDGTAGAGVTGGHDFVNLTGAVALGALTYGGTLTLDIGTTFGAGSYAWDLFNFASESGTYTTIVLAGTYSGSLLDSNADGIWDLTSGINTWQFTESTGVLGLTVAVPEPATVAAVIGLAALGLALWRRRRG